MAQQLIDVGSAASDSSYDSPRTMALKINANFAEVATSAVTTLTDAPTITWATGGVAAPNAIITLAGNRTLAITGAVSGQRGILIAVQDATGSRTLTLPVGSKASGTPTTTAAAVNRYDYLYDGTNYWWEITANLV